LAYAKAALSRPVLLDRGGAYIADEREERPPVVADGAGFPDPKHQSACPLLVAEKNLAKNFVRGTLSSWLPGIVGGTGASGVPNGGPVHQPDVDRPAGAVPPQDAGPTASIVVASPLDDPVCRGRS